MRSAGPPPRNQLANRGLAGRSQACSSLVGAVLDGAGVRACASACAVCGCAGVASPYAAPRAHDRARGGALRSPALRPFRRIVGDFRILLDFPSRASGQSYLNTASGGAARAPLRRLRGRGRCRCMGSVGCHVYCCRARGAAGLGNYRITAGHGGYAVRLGITNVRASQKARRGYQREPSRESEHGVGGEQLYSELSWQEGQRAYGDRARGR